MNNRFEVVNGVLDLGSEIDVNLVADLYQELKHEIVVGSSVLEINTSEIKRTDGATLQLLASFSKEYMKSGGDISWGNPSDEFWRASKILGLTEVLGIPDRA